MIPIDPRYNSLFSCSWWGFSPATPLFRPAHIGHVFLFRFLRFHWRSFHRLPPRSRWPWRVLRSARPRGRPVRRPRPDLARDNPPRIQWFIGESEPETVEVP